MRHSSSCALVCLLSASACNVVMDPDADPSDEPTDPGAARVRVAHLSPDAPPVDFCLAPAGTQEFAGPVLGGAGAPLGISYANVTRYFEVDARRYDVRLVAPGAADCGRALVPDVTDLPALPAARYDVRVVRAGDPGGCANAAVADTAGVSVAAGVTATVAALGVIDRSGAASHDPSFKLAVRRRDPDGGGQGPSSASSTRRRARRRWTSASARRTRSCACSRAFRSAAWARTRRSTRRASPR